MAERANKLLEFIFSQPPDDYIRHMLMGLFTKIVNMEQPLSKYSMFFNSNLTNEKETTVFAQTINETFHKYQVLPSQGKDAQSMTALDTEIQDIVQQSLIKTRQKDQALDFIMHLDNIA